MKLSQKTSTISNATGTSGGFQKISVRWLNEDKFNKLVYFGLSLLSLGILPLVCFFYPHWRIEMTSRECNPADSEFAVVTLPNGSEHCVKIFHYKCALTEEHLISLEVNGVRYCASSYDNFSLIAVPDVPVNFLRFLVPQSITHSKEILNEERKILFAHYGPNAMELPEANGLEIFIRHAFSPFYLFQYFSVTVWFIENYVLYAILILGITLSAVIVTTQESIFNLERLRHLAGHEAEVDILNIPDNVASASTAIYNTSSKYRVSDSQLIPGDQFIVVPGQHVPCDAVLISGRVVVEESMLTGESVPANKSAIEVSAIEGDRSVLKRGSLYNTQSSIPSIPNGKSSVFDIAAKKSGNLLFSGTKVRACHGGPCVAVCYRTSFRSAKGQLIASLLNPKEGFMNFISDALLVILCMLILTTILYIAVAVILTNMGVSSDVIVLRYFDAITVAVPPALTACLTVATAISVSRLKDKQIFVSDTTRVNWAGSISATCFDKTGTLTEDRLNFRGAYLSVMSENGGYALKEYGIKPSDLPSTCLEIMATCHSLAILDVHSSSDEEPVGDPLELELLRASRWTLSLGDKTANMRAKSFQSDGFYDILRHFEFTPERLRAATLLKRPNGSLSYLLKGSPEVISALCEPTSVPEDLISSLALLSKKGLRVIAIAYRECREQESYLMQQPQSQIEALGRHYISSFTSRLMHVYALGGIIFLGLLALSSPLKTETKATIERLNLADIHVNMITGDYIHTAIAVAVDCGILHPFNHRHNTLYIVDEREGDGATIIIDATTNQTLNQRYFFLEKLLDIAALTSVVPPSVVPVSTFATKDVPSESRNLSIFTPPEGQLQIAVTGRGLLSVQRNYSPAIVSALIRYAKVFARTKPSDKKSVVDELLTTNEIDLHLLELVGYTDKSSRAESTPLLTGSRSNEDEGSVLVRESNSRGTHSVLFCGDGANDMSALRAATVGVSLCDTETSVAAPVTSKLQTPSSVIETIIEGRCSLITAYVLVLFNIMYGVIQLIMTIMLYSYGLIAGDYMYLTQDLFYTLVLGLAIALTPPSEFFGKAVPPKRFLSAYLMTKLVLQLVIFVVFQLLSLWALSLQSFYTRFETDDPLTSTYSYEATTIDTMCLVQLMIASVVSTIGEPFRKPWYTNRYHVGALTLQFGWVLYQLFGDRDYFSKSILDLKQLPIYFCFILMFLMILNVLVSWLANSFAESLRPNPYIEKLDVVSKAKDRLAKLTSRLHATESVGNIDISIL